MIILKQCLDHDIVPIIIRDVNKSEYSRYLNRAQHEKDYDSLIRYFEKEQDWFIEQTLPMLFSIEERNKNLGNDHVKTDLSYDDFEEDGFDPADE